MLQCRLALQRELKCDIQDFSWIRGMIPSNSIRLARIDLLWREVSFWFSSGA